MSGTTPPAVEWSGTNDYGVRFFGNPLRLAFSASPWRSAAFLFSYLIMSGVLFSVAFTAAVTAAALAYTLIAFPLLIAAAMGVCPASPRKLSAAHRGWPAGAGQRQLAVSRDVARACLPDRALGPADGAGHDRGQHLGNLARRRHPSALVLGALGGVWQRAARPRGAAGLFPWWPERGRRPRPLRQHAAEGA